MLTMSDEDKSVKFLQVSIPCKECLVQGACQDRLAIDRKMQAQDLFDFLLALRRWDESKKVYRKGLIEAWANLGWDIFQNMRTSEFNELPPEVAPVYLDTLIELSAVIQWIINSLSWREGQKFDFDIREIKHKIEMAKKWVGQTSRNMKEK